MADEKDTKLVAALRQAKQAPMFFAFVAKGATDGVLMVAKKKIPVKEISEAKAESGGKVVFRGRCFGEGAKMVFEVPKEPPAVLAKQLKAVIQQSAGMMLAVVVRIGQGLEDETSESEGEIPTPPPPQTTTGQVPPPPPPQAPPKQDDQAAARYTTKLKALAPVLQKVAGINNAPAKEAKQAVTEANALYQSKQYGDALDVLNMAEGLLKEALTADAKAQATPQGDPAAANRCAARLKALAPVVQKVEGTGSPLGKQMKDRHGEANQLYLDKKYDAAAKALDDVEALAKQALTARAKPGADGFAKAWPAARDAWQNASDTVDGQITQLQAKLRNSGDNDLREIGEFGLNGVTGNFKVPLMTAMREIDGVQGEALQAAIVKARKIVTDFQKHIQGSEQVLVCDDNPFDVKVTIRDSIGQALSQMEQALTAGA